ncbi:MAG: NUDIX hydrolase [Anaerolineae bacterium]|nr:NUDIX hydrolase [Anaerolineae bacterium]
MKPWTTLTCRLLLDRPPWLRIWEEDVLLPDGQRIHGYLRAEARDYAMVFARLADGTVPLVRQYKHGIGAESYDLPAGYLDSPAEPPLHAAQRELHEETGLRAHAWEPLGHLVIDTNRGATRAHIFLARDAYPDGPAHLDETESLTVSFHLPEELRSLVRSGRINSLASVAGIMLALDALSTPPAQ